MGKVNYHPNIIKFCGVTTLEGKDNIFFFYVDRKYWDNSYTTQ
jgi:hypothetical protein